MNNKDLSIPFKLKRRVVNTFKVATTGKMAAPSPESNPRGGDGTSNDFPIDAWSDPTYDSWFRTNKISEDELIKQKQEQKSFTTRPLFSIISPLYNTPLEYLDDLIESVLLQTYNSFELILVNASPNDELLKFAVGAYQEIDKKIKVVNLDKNYGITLNTEEGIKVANGDYICFLDHDDFLEPNCLFEYAKAINNNPNGILLYCDEDLVVKNGINNTKYLHPLFKPDFSPELLLSKNYIVHLMCVKKEIIDSMPTRDSKFDGAQDYNMVLYATTQILNNDNYQAIHIPMVLYHWRISDVSTAANPKAKPYGRISYRFSAQEHLKRLNLLDNSKIIHSGITNIHTLWFDDQPEKKVSLIIYDENSDYIEIQDTIDLFLQSNTHKNIEIIIAPAKYKPTNAQKIIDKFSQCEIKILNFENSLSAIELVNSASQQATGQYLVFLPVSCQFISPESIEQLMGLMQIKNIAVCAPKTIFAFDNKVKSYGFSCSKNTILPLYRGYNIEHPAYQCNTYAFQNCSAASIEGMIISKETFEKYGYLSTMYSSINTSITHFCQLLIQDKLRICLNPNVKLMSADECPKEQFNTTYNMSDFPKNDIELFYSNWPKIKTNGDKFYNINLDQKSPYFQLPIENYEQ
ncbi:MAG: glycosyltransferase [Coriobacteriales bacterium]|nr:glycosyltransferase [Coriobacteriales bacterium]